MNLRVDLYRSSVSGPLNLKQISQFIVLVSFDFLKAVNCMLVPCGNSYKTRQIRDHVCNCI